MRRKNIIAGMVLIILAIVYGVMTSMLPTRTLPNTPDPSFFPWINTVVIIALSFWLLVSSFDAQSVPKVQVPTYQKKQVLWFLGSFLVYVIAMPGLGFIFATAPFFAVVMMLFGERRPAWVGGGAIGVTIALYLLFRHGFGVFLPRGLLADFIV